MTFELVADVVPSGGVRLANGFTARMEDWQAVAVTAFAAGKDALGRPAYATCTAALVGEKVLLTAAHCLDTGKDKEFRKAFLQVDGRSLDVTCDPDPRYFAAKYKGRSPRSSFDFALCELSWTGLKPATLDSMTFETVDTETSLRPISGGGKPVVLTGYGCSGLQVENHRLTFTADTGIFRIGQEAIETGVSASGTEPGYVILRSGKGVEPALCPGDSGGPLMSGLKVVPPLKPDGVATLISDGDRRVRGVNSSIDFEDRAQGPYDYISRVSALAGTGFDSYARGWLKRHANASICGLSTGAARCI
ncbi:trypsin-like serine protease [Sphingomonas sp. BK235]|uniref:trypsin-like serine peptidase n=1 Tax=Sphingomonas sp. BK235 TaxID=2512131 RepID=UPI0010D2E785|nr:trypsin-like serine protease [Sphingomonas sp. BK235]TCP30113.1 trypsin [Sphingomonas sp. BK235]